MVLLECEWGAVGYRPTAPIAGFPRFRPVG